MRLALVLVCLALVNIRQGYGLDCYSCTSSDPDCDTVVVVDTTVITCAGGEGFCSTSATLSGGATTITRACATTAATGFCTGTSTEYTCDVTCGTDLCNADAGPSYMLSCYVCMSTDEDDTTCDNPTGITHRAICTGSNNLCSTSRVASTTGDVRTITVTRACTDTAVTAPECTGQYEDFNCQATCDSAACNIDNPSVVLSCYVCSDADGSACETPSDATHQTDCATTHTHCSTTRVAATSGGTKTFTLTRSCTDTAASTTACTETFQDFNCATTCVTANCNTDLPAILLSCYVCTEASEGATCQTTDGSSHQADCEDTENYCSVTTTADSAGGTQTLERACAAAEASGTCAGTPTDYTCTTSCQTDNCNVDNPEFQLTCYDCTSVDNDDSTCETPSGTTHQANCASGNTLCSTTVVASTSSDVRTITLTRECTNTAASSPDCTGSYDSLNCATTCDTHGSTCENPSGTTHLTDCASTDTHCSTTTVLSTSGGTETTTLTRACASAAAPNTCTGTSSDYTCTFTCTTESCNTNNPEFQVTCYDCTSVDNADSNCETPSGTTHQANCASGNTLCSTTRVATTTNDVRTVTLTRACTNTAETAPDCTGTYDNMNCAVTCSTANCNTASPNILLKCYVCTSTDAAEATCEEPSGTTSQMDCASTDTHCLSTRVATTSGQTTTIVLTRQCGTAAATNECTGTSGDYTCPFSCATDSCNTVSAAFETLCYICTSINGSLSTCDTVSGTTHQAACPSGQTQCTTTRTAATVDGVRTVNVTRGCSSVASANACTGDFNNFTCEFSCTDDNCNNDVPNVPLTCYVCTESDGATCQMPNGTTHQTTCTATETLCSTTVQAVLTNDNSVTSLSRGCSETMATNVCNGTVSTFVCTFTCGTVNCNTDNPAFTTTAATPIFGQAPTHHKNVILLIGSLMIIAFANQIILN